METPAPAVASDPMERLERGSAIAAVVGLQFGDEGKGQIVDALAERYDLVVRYNGGANAGHSVHIGKAKFALHLIPSGILNPSAVNLVGHGVVIDPIGILGEIDGLRERGVAVQDNLRLSSRAHVVMGYHKTEDRLRDAAIAVARGDAGRIGTTGRGIGPCYADKAHRAMAIRMCDLVDAKVLRRRLEEIVPIKNATLTALARFVGESFEPLDVDELFDKYNGCGRRLAPFVCDSAELLRTSIAEGKRVLFEGANAAMLDVDHGTFPYVTSSQTTSAGVFSGAALAGSRPDRIMGVVKCYTSRVGGGPFPTELFDEQGEQLRSVGQEYGTTTGRPRRTGWLDLLAVRYAARLNGCTGLVCTGLSVLSGVGTLRVCEGYDVDGQRFDTMPPAIHQLQAAKPIFREMEGFDGPLGEARAYSELPSAAKAYIEQIESFVGVPVVAVCVGRRRDQVLVR